MSSGFQSNGRQCELQPMIYDPGPSDVGFSMWLQALVDLKMVNGCPGQSWGLQLVVKCAPNTTVGAFGSGPHSAATVVPFLHQTLCIHPGALLPDTGQGPQNKVRKPYLVDVQQILWDRTNLCRHCALLAQDDAEVTVSIQHKSVAWLSLETSHPCPNALHSQQ